MTPHRPSPAVPARHRVARTLLDVALRAVGLVAAVELLAAVSTESDPLAAGLIAFGVGWLVSSLLPATQREQQLAQQAESAVRDNRDTLLAPAKQAAQEIGEQLRPAAQEAVEYSGFSPSRPRGIFP